MHLNIRTIAASLVIGIASVGFVSTASATPAKSKAPRCHAIVKGKKSWSVKFCPKSGKPGANGKNGSNGVNGKDGVNGANGERGNDGVNGKNGADGKSGASGVGAQGPQGERGTPGLNGVSGYEVRTWDYANAGPGGVATVACSSQSKVAVGGGFYIRDANSADMSSNHPSVSNGAGAIVSMPGRMDWDGVDDIAGNADDNTVRPGRNDGWIVRFNDKGAGAVTLYVICINAA